MEKIKVRQIYWHDANYTDETNWLSKKDVKKLIAEMQKINGYNSPLWKQLNELKSKIEGKNDLGYTKRK